MKFLALLSFGVVGTLCLKQTELNHEWKPNLGSMDCCKAKGWIVCGKAIKDCCDASRCDSGWFGSQHCPDNTQVDDDDLDCERCSDVCEAKSGGY